MSTPTITVAIAYHSGYGHTARMARAVAAGVASVSGARPGLHDVSSVDEELWNALDDAQAIIFGSPTYMGGPSAVFQAFAEGSSKAWAELRWRDKVAAGFTNSAGVNGDKLNTLVAMALLAAQHGMHWVGLGLPPGWLHTSTGSPDDLNRLAGFLGAMAQSPSDLGPDEAPSDADLRTAEHLGRRVAEAALDLVRGRRATAASGLVATR